MPPAERSHARSSRWITGTSRPARIESRLDHHREALADADADRGQAVAAPAAVQLVAQRADDARDRLAAERGARPLVADEERRGPVAERGGVAGGHGAALPEGGPQLRERRERGVGPDALVALELRPRHGHDLAVEPAGV